MSVRVIRKGGIWKNTEDEILKAAVMKYGKNQWARIASLLSRKTAKQCKARWYEWLDPSIKKIEWSREEEEKLLHMAKIMPTQWRTIAAIVGRTAAQCLEHYEKLLDQATGRDDYDPSDDPRRLRPGEIDPNPEARPARPDQIDMEEDEKEMLQEARARLANTKGKKAKRKAREKQLEEARRLASLQKRRELKAAGIISQKHQRKRRGMNYNKEIPFLHTPAMGFYSVEDENEREREMKKNPKFRPILLQQLEGDRRDDIEMLKRKEDLKKAKNKKDDGEFKIPVEKPIRRTELVTPTPQMSEREIAELSKAGNLPDEEIDENNPTSELLSNYAATPQHHNFGQSSDGPSGPMTPLTNVERTPLRADTIRMEAQNLAAMQQMNTPLLGGENPFLHPSDYTSATPRQANIQTPNPNATPLRSGIPGDTSSGGMTPGGMTPRSGQGSSGVIQKPLRDQLSINSGYNENEDDGFMDEERSVSVQSPQDIKRNVLSGLASLPTPKPFKPQIPDVGDLGTMEESSINKGTSSFIQDEQDIEKATKLERQQEREAKLTNRSQALKLDLPRPLSVNAAYAKDEKEIMTLEREEDRAAELIKLEMVSLLTLDAIEYPTKNIKPPVKVNPDIFLQNFEIFDARELNEARALLVEETKLLIADQGEYDETTFEEAWENSYNDLIYVPQSKKFGLSSHIKSDDIKVSSIQHFYDNTISETKKVSKKVQVSEKKAKILLGGYMKIAATKEKEIQTLQDQIQQYECDLECFKALQEREDASIIKRLEALKTDVRKQRELEKETQQKFASLVREKEELLSKAMQVEKTEKTLTV